VLVFLLLAGSTPAAERTHTVTVDDYFTLATITELAVSPHSTHVAYCESRWQESTDDRKSELWVVATDGKSKPRRLTFDRAGERHPRWAADGKVIYVLANRKREAEKKPPYDGTAQVWRVPLDGGDPRAVTHLEGGVVAFDYAPQTDTLFYTADTTATDDDNFAQLRSKFGKLEYGHGSRKVSEVYRLDLQSWRAEKIIAHKRYVREFAVTGDGKRVGMITAPDDTVITSEGRSRVEVWDASTGKVTETDASWKKTAASPYPWLENLAWSPDGKQLAFNTVFDAYPAEVIVEDWKDGKWTATRVRRPSGVHIHGYGTPLKWAAINSLALLTEEKGVVRLALWSSVSDSEQPLRVQAPLRVSLFDFAVNNMIALTAEADRFPRIVTALEDGFHDTLVDSNPHTAAWKLPSVKHITWKATDGTEVGGVLELPADHKPGTMLPLVVGIHGGPTTSVQANLEYNPYDGRLYFAAKGFAVLCPNYRGSTGYGDKFVTDLIGHENDVEVKDILAGVQHLVKEGIADPERIAVMGWSNGGYLTNCLITLKDPPVKIKAASSGAGILDTVAEWGFNDEPAYPIVFKKGLPWETPDIYRKSSPTYGIGNVSTPTLIHVGGGDERCPPGHSRMLYRALREYKKVPTELVVYPTEPHGLTKYTNRKAKMEWDLAWFEKYVLGK
jgi:dipeptidyl aminopeptidase/acylaminoacyl peptidase